MISKGEKIMNKWIKTTERKPDVWETVIVACYGSDIVAPMAGESVGECIARQKREIKRVTLGFIDDEGFWNGADGFPMMISPTYWQPLPEAPEYGGTE